MRFLILGAGFQGRACAYDMLRNPAVTGGRVVRHVRGEPRLGEEVPS